MDRCAPGDPREAFAYTVGFGEAAVGGGAGEAIREVSGEGVAFFEGGYVDLTDALITFEAKLRDHLPSSEAGVREFLAQSIRETMTLRPEEVEVEASFGAKRHDIMIHPTEIGIELKYHRRIPSGRNRPMTAQYGQLLADVRKLLSNGALASGLLVLLTDEAGRTHLINKHLLPAAWGRSDEITAAEVAGLANSASGPATAAGPWIDATTSLVWMAERIGNQGLTGFAWSVDVLPS